MLGIGGLAVFLITLIVFPGMNENAEGLKEHVSERAHVVAMNEFKHLNADLEELKEDVVITKDYVMKIYYKLCPTMEEC